MGTSAIDFLSHHTSLSGVHFLASKVNAGTKFPCPTSVRQLQEFMGMVNYYHRFIPGLTYTMGPLYSALLGMPKSLLWEVQQEEAFIATKKSFASATTLCFPAPDALLFLSMDKGNVAVGAVLNQIINCTSHPLLFYSRKLNAAKKTTVCLTVSSSPFISPSDTSATC